MACNAGLKLCASEQRCVDRAIIEAADEGMSRAISRT